MLKWEFRAHQEKKISNKVQQSRTKTNTCNYLVILAAAAGTGRHAKNLVSVVSQSQYGNTSHFCDQEDGV